MYLNICQYLYLVVSAFVLTPATIAAVVNESIFFKSIFRQGLLALQATVLSTELAQVMFFTCPRLAWGRGGGWNLWKTVHTSALVCCGSYTCIFKCNSIHTGVGDGEGRGRGCIQYIRHFPGPHVK